MQNDKNIDRRTFLKSAAAVTSGLVFSSGKLCAVASNGPYKPIDDLEMYDFILPRVKITEQSLIRGNAPDKWNVRPGGDKNLLRHLSAVIRCTTKPFANYVNNWEPDKDLSEKLFNAVVTFDDIDKIKKYPFLFMTDENYYQFNSKQKETLKDYIYRGGFLLMDDCVYLNGGDFFYQSSFRMLEEIFGAGAVKRIPNEHEIFHNVYDMGDTGLSTWEYSESNTPIQNRRSGIPYLHGQNHGARGVYIGDRLAVFLSSTDLHCGWCDSLGEIWTLPCYEQSIHMGINIIMYAMSH